jgi:hypothetical protein
MAIQSDFLGIKDLKELTPRKRAALQDALEDLIIPNAELQSQALCRLSQMDAHRRSPLAVAFLGTRIIEPDIVLRAKIVSMLATTLTINERAERSPSKVLKILRNILCEIGDREVHALLDLVVANTAMLDPVCTILDQCSICGKTLVDIVNKPTLDVAIRIAAAEVIAKIGFLEAIQPMELLERRLVDRTFRQVAMNFASRKYDEAEQLIPVLRQTLEALEEAGF